MRKPDFVTCHNGERLFHVTETLVLFSKAVNTNKLTRNLRIKQVTVVQRIWQLYSWLLERNYSNPLFRNKVFEQNKDIRRSLNVLSCCLMFWGLFKRIRVLLYKLTQYSIWVFYNRFKKKVVLQIVGRFAECLCAELCFYSTFVLS